MGSCTDCRFSEPVLDEHDGEPFLQCRRYPPSIGETADGEIVVEFPAVTGETWCGEHSAKDDHSAETTLRAAARRLVRRLRGDTLRA